jgi:hypothetical protein
MSKVCDEKVWISTLPSFLSILESLKCLEEITWQMLPPVLTQNAKQFRTNYLAAAAIGIDTKCEAI